MYTILLTCLLFGGQTFSLPQGWDVIEIRAFHPSGHLLNLADTTRFPEQTGEVLRPVASVTLRQTVKVDQALQVPDKCTVSLHAPKE